ncbi:serine protease snake-like isoform X2 [Atheta coriaria]|uniref:serine protease snake-like isoform X2 n=1 Tax=Dalotia coriaria TaxID=877792 RepID=UPI0031F3CC73
MFNISFKMFFSFLISALVISLSISEGEYVERKRKIGDISKEMCNKEPRFIKFDVFEARKVKPGFEEMQRKLREKRQQNGENIGGRGGIGGENTEWNKYTHMAALGYGEWKNVKWGCGGTLISDTFVMTAAHCIDTILGRLKYIRLDDINPAMNDNYSYPQDFNALQIFVHPGYNPPSAYHDIALVELDHPVDRLGNNIIPACLQVEQNIADPKWSALGWGETSYNGPTADHLQLMQLQEADFTVCKNAYLNAGERRLEHGVDNDSQMCAGKGDVDTCSGDSGGPLQIPNKMNDTGFTVIGITSFGKKCGLTTKPSVYTRVSYYIEWIESIVWPQ